MLKIQRILFICYANTCRSPAAEYFAKDLKHNKYKNEMKDVIFDSAGWHDAFEDAQPETKNYVQDKGIDMSDFKPKVITKELIEKQDLIIGMERYQLTKVRNNFREIKENIRDKLYTLKEFNGAEKKDVNIPDPYKTGLDNYKRILKIVEENVEKMAKKIIEINSIN